jgi:hypothetical protein
MFHRCAGNDLKPGQIVKVVNLPSAPKANTMGQCYVANPLTGKFICMVSTGSLHPMDAEMKALYKDFSHTLRNEHRTDLMFIYNDHDLQITTEAQ